MALGLKSVAIVDDEVSVRRALKRLLRSAGYEAETYASGAEFIEALAQGTPGCLIADIHMPAMSGIELVGKLRAREQIIPVILISAFDYSECEMQAMRDRGLIFLRKPVEVGALLDAIVLAVGSATRH